MVRTIATSSHRSTRVPPGCSSPPPRGPSAAVRSCSTRPPSGAAAGSRPGRERTVDIPAVVIITLGNLAPGKVVSPAGPRPGRLLAEELRAAAGGGEDGPRRRAGALLDDGLVGPRHVPAQDGSRAGGRRPRGGRDARPRPGAERGVRPGRVARVRHHLRSRAPRGDDSGEAAGALRARPPAAEREEDLRPRHLCGGGGGSPAGPPTVSGAAQRKPPG